MSPGPDHGTNTTEGTWQDRSIAVQRVLWGQTAWGTSLTLVGRRWLGAGEESGDDLVLSWFNFQSHHVYSWK